MSLLNAALQSLRTHTEPPWKTLRDPELSREAPKARSTQAWTMARNRFLCAIQDGKNDFLPSDVGPRVCVQDWLTECAPEEAKAMMLQAAMHIACGRPMIGAELMGTAVQLCAECYADNDEGFYE